MGCDLCGKEGILFKALVEKTELTVCEKCGSYGKILRKVVPEIPKPKKLIPKKPEVVEHIVQDYAGKIRQAREKLELTQEEFAKKIAEKESIVHKLESGSFEPSIPLAKKLEKMLHIKLVEAIEEETVNITKGKTTGLTIGDMLKFK